MLTFRRETVNNNFIISHFYEYLPNFGKSIQLSSSLLSSPSQHQQKNQIYKKKYTRRFESFSTLIFYGYLCSLSTCGAVNFPVISPIVTSIIQAYSSVSLSRGNPSCENMAWPRTCKPDRHRCPSFRCWWHSGRYKKQQCTILRHLQVKQMEMNIFARCATTLK